MAATGKNRTAAVSYLRVSSAGQVDGDGLPRQRAAVKRYADRAGIELVGEYTDAGVSGTRELDDRAGLSDLLARIRSNGVRTVLVENATRLARDLMVSEIILGQFRDLGVSVIAADSGTDLTVADDDPTRKLIRQVLGAVAEFEKSVLVSKLRAARVRKRRETGKCEGRKAYGEKAGEAETLAYIRQLRRKPRNRPARSFTQIAAQLNAENVPTRSGQPWNTENVRKLLRR